MQSLPTLRESIWLSRFCVAVGVVALALLIAVVPVLGSALVLAGLILVAAVLIEPRWGLYLLPFAVPFGSIREVAIGPATVGGTEALLGLFLLAWLARGVARREVRLERPPLLAAMALWYGAMLLSVVNSDSLADSAKELIKWGETFALYTIAAQELRPRDIVIVAGTTLAAGTLAAVEGIYQSVFQIGPEGFLFPLAGRIWLRAYGQFTQPNPYAGYLGLVLPLGYGLLAVGVGLGAGVSKRPAAGTVLQRLVSTTGLLTVVGVCTGVMGAALFLTLSRGAWIGAVAAFVVVGALLSRRAALASVTVGLVLALTFALAGTDWLPPALAARATDFLPYINVFDVQVRGVQITNENFAVIERLAHWQAAYAMWADYPWLGQGIGNYAAVYPNYYIPPWRDPLGHAHNLFLNTLAETGLIGLLAYLLFWGQAFWLTLQATRRSSGWWRGIAVGTLGAMVHLHTHNFFDNLYVHGMYLHIALLLAIAAIMARSSRKIPS